MADVDAAPKHLNSNLPSWIAVTVKSSRDRKDLVVEDNKTIAQFKAQVAKELNVTKEQLCLVFYSRSLKDSSTLKQCGITEGSTVRVVIKTPNMLPGSEVLQNEAIPEVNVGPSPFGLDALGGLGGLIDMGFGSTSFIDVQRRMQKKLHSNPSLMKSLLHNPIVKDLMSKPDLYGQLVASNPSIAEVAQENPELSEILGNPSLMKQMLSLASKPDLLQELIAPKHEDVIGPNKSKDDDDDDGIPSAKRQKLDSGETDQSTDKDEHAFMGKGTESLLKQMINHSKDMSNILQAPYIQSAINFAATNPEYLRMMMNHIPGVDDSESMKKQLDLAMPYFAQQLSNPEVQNLMCNPRALQAMLDIQEGLRELHEQVPGYFTSKNDASTPDVKCSNVLNEVLSSVTSHVSDLPDEDKYATQLRHLYHMGCTDHEENLRVLSMASGDINSAIIHHIQNPFQQQQAEDYQQDAEEDYEQQEPDQSEVEHGEDLLPLAEEQEHLTEPESDVKEAGLAERLLLLEGEGSEAEAGFVMQMKEEDQ